MVLATATTGHGVGSIVRDSSLIIYYDPYLKQSYSGSGTTYTDLSGNNNTGTLQNSPTFNTTDFSFNGTNQYISTTTSFTNPNLYTTALWYKTTSTAGRILVEFENTQTGTGSTVFSSRKMWSGTDGKLYTGLVDSGGTIRYAQTGSSVADGVWRYASAHYDGTNLTLYLNGVFIATYPNIGTPSGTTGWWRFAAYKGTGWPTHSDGYFTGNIGPIHVYNRLLSAAEVLQNFNADRGKFGV
jgi:hypothetical protein